MAPSSFRAWTGASMVKRCTLKRGRTNARIFASSTRIERQERQSKNKNGYLKYPKTNVDRLVMEDQILREWLEGLSDKENLGDSARSMGRAALDVGLSKTAWSESISFAEGLGLGEELASGVWLEKDAEPLDSWPAALDPLAIILGLVMSVPKSTPADRNRT